MDTSTNSFLYGHVSIVELERHSGYWKCICLYGKGVIDTNTKFLFSKYSGSFLGKFLESHPIMRLPLSEKSAPDDLPPNSFFFVLENTMANTLLDTSLKELKNEETELALMFSVSKSVLTPTAHEISDHEAFLDGLRNSLRDKSANDDDDAKSADADSESLDEDDVNVAVSAVRARHSVDFSDTNGDNDDD